MSQDDRLVPATADALTAALARVPLPALLEKENPRAKRRFIEFFTTS